MSAYVYQPPKHPRHLTLPASYAPERCDWCGAPNEAHPDSGVRSVNCLASHDGYGHVHCADPRCSCPRHALVAQP